MICDFIVELSDSQLSLEIRSNLLPSHKLGLTHLMPVFWFEGNTGIYWVKHQTIRNLLTDFLIF